MYVVVDLSFCCARGFSQRLFSCSYTEIFDEQICGSDWGWDLTGKQLGLRRGRDSSLVLIQKRSTCMYIFWFGLCASMYCFWWRPTGKRNRGSWQAILLLLYHN